MTNHQDNTQHIQRLRSLIQEIACGVLTTIDDDGSLHSRPMLISGDIEADGTLWLLTLASSHKVTEIAQHQQVSISFCSHEKQQYLSISGTAFLVRDRNKLEEKWRPELTKWFPRGLAEPDLALLKVKINRADHWENSLSFTPEKIIFSPSQDYSLR